MKSSELRALHEAATKEPWDVVEAQEGSLVAPYIQTGYLVDERHVALLDAVQASDGDVDLLVALRNEAPRLIAALALAEAVDAADQKFREEPHGDEDTPEHIKWEQEFIIACAERKRALAAFRAVKP